MNIDWNSFKYKFLDHINDSQVEQFNDFERMMGRLTPGDKGIYFEYFCSLYFELDPITRSNFKKFYLYTDIPQRMKDDIRLPDIDKGIDCIVIDNDDNIYAIQVKYRTDKNIIIPFGELATFPALTYGTMVKVKGGIFLTNCYDVCDELKNDKYTHILYNSLVEKCNRLFWQNVREYIGDKPITKYIPLQPLKHHIPIISDCRTHYEKHNNGRLYLACGTGKTFLGYWISVRELKCMKIFVVVPSLYLLSQTYETWMREMQYDDDKYHFILIGSDMEIKNDILCEYRPTTNIDIISDELQRNDRVVVITTYHSSGLLINACQKLGCRFDFGIYDEAHRTVGEENGCFTSMIGSGIEQQRLFMTATEKVYNYNKSGKSNEGTNIDRIISMDNEKIYGPIVHRYSMRKAIEDNVLVDYQIVAPFINSDYSEIIKNNPLVNDNNDSKYDMRIILTGLMIIKSMEYYKFRHLLIFSNTNKRAKKIMEFIDNSLKGRVTCKFLSGDDNMNIRKGAVTEFEKCEIGIISSARIFGEGVDIKICDAICFADGKSSSVDIVQYVGRCLRKCPIKPNKLSYVLVPFILDEYDDFFDYDNQSYLKLRKILKTIGTTDQMVSEKFVLMNCNENCVNIDKDKNENTKNVIQQFDIQQFTKDVITKVFDKSGEIIDNIRNVIILENTRRYNDNVELIDTKRKCVQFLKNRNVDADDIPQNISNWVLYCIGVKLFDKIRNNYYSSIDEFINACMKIGIYDSDSYVNNYKCDPKLPPFEYIDDGFYTYLDSTFNLTHLLSKNCEDIDF